MLAPWVIGAPVVPGGDMTGGRIHAKGGPIAALIALVLGGIYGGAFTPVEAGAMGGSARTPSGSWSAP